MTTLHLISQPLSLLEFKKQIERFLGKKDQLLFIGDSVTSLLDIEIKEMLNNKGVTSYALKADCECRGIIELVTKQVTQINDEAMVNLTLKHQKVFSW